MLRAACPVSRESWSVQAWTLPSFCVSGVLLLLMLNGRHEHIKHANPRSRPRFRLYPAMTSPSLNPPHSSIDRQRHGRRCKRRAFRSSLPRFTCRVHLQGSLPSLFHAILRARLAWDAGCLCWCESGQLALFLGPGGKSAPIWFGFQDSSSS